MKNKTVITQIKEQEEILNLLSQLRGFMISINDNKDNTGTMTIQRKKHKIIYLDSFDISGIFESQINISRNGKILETGLYINDIIRWLYNFTNYDSLEFLYQFHGGIYNSRIMTTKELQKATNTIITKIEMNNYLNFEDQLTKLPIIPKYSKPTLSHIDYRTNIF